MKEIRVVIQETREDLKAIVESYVENGWEAIGDVEQQFLDGTGFLFTQAVVRYDNIKEEKQMKEQITFESKGPVTLNIPAAQEIKILQRDVEFIKNFLRVNSWYTRVIMWSLGISISLNIFLIWTVIQ